MNSGYLGHYSNIPHRQYQVDNHYMAPKPMVHQYYKNNGMRLEDLQLENLATYMNHNYNMGPKPALENLATYMNHNYYMGPKPALENLAMGGRNVYSHFPKTAYMNLEDVDLQNLVLVNGPNDVMVFGSNGITKNGVDISNDPNIQVTHPTDHQGTVHHTESGSADFSSTSSSTHSGSGTKQVSSSSSSSTSTTSDKGAVYLQAVAATVMAAIVTMC